VIGRRALGFKEDELKEQLKRETNQYKRNTINSELKQVQKAKDLLLEKLKNLQG